MKRYSLSLGVDANGFVVMYEDYVREVEELERRVRWLESSINRSVYAHYSQVLDNILDNMYVSGDYERGLKETPDDFE